MTRAVALLATVLLLACRSAPRPMYGRAQIDACVAAKTEARAALPEHRACSADWECEAWSTQMLGCDGVVARGAAPQGLERKVWDACSGVPARALACPGKIPACLEGRCGFRPPSRVGCEDARHAYRARLEAGPNACGSDDDCTRILLENESELAVPASLVPEVAREAHAYADACAPDSGAEVRQAHRWARCVDQVCTLSTEMPAMVGWAKPRQVDASCVERALFEQADRLRRHAPMAFEVKFAVRNDGRPAAFSFSRPLPGDVEAAAADAILSCRWAPGTYLGNPRPIWVMLPIRLAR